jgi:hypothetical protein
LLIWLGDVFFLVIVMIVACCYIQRREDNNRRRQEAAAVAPHAQPAPAVQAAAVQMAAMAGLRHVPSPAERRRFFSTSTSGGGSGGDHPSADGCAIYLGQLEDGDWCSVMSGCRHEFHRSCIAKWLMACNNTCVPIV